MVPLLPLLLLLILQGSLGPERADAVIRAIDPVVAARICGVVSSANVDELSAREIAEWLGRSERKIQVDTPIIRKAIVAAGEEPVRSGYAQHVRSRDGPRAYGA